MSADAQSVGNLSERSLAHLFLWVYQSTFSGVLVLARDTVKKSLVFERGKLVAARSNVSGEILGAILMEEGKITPEALARSVEMLKGKQAIRQGEVLIEMGLIDHAMLNEVLEKQLLRRVYEVFTWPEGRYGFVSKIPEDTARIDPNKSLLEICYRGLLEKHRGSKESADLSESTTPNFVGGQNWSVEQLRLVGREMGVWRAINGVASLGQIIERSRLDSRTVRSVLLALRDMGLVRIESTDKLIIETESLRRRATGRRRVTGSEGGKGADEEIAIREVLSLLDDFRTRNHFEILGVPRTADSMAIKSAYFTLAKKYHPDRVGIAPGSPERKSVEDLFAKISEAHGVLTNDASRKEYEATLDLAQSGAIGSAEAVKVLESEMTFQKASVLVRKGDFAGAIELLKTAIGLYDKEPEYHLLLGWALHRNASKSKDAAGMKAGKVMIDKALVQNERLTQGYFYQGLIAKSEGDIEGAKKYFEKTVALDPKHNEANSELRVLNMRQMKGAATGGIKGFFKKKEG